MPIVIERETGVIREAKLGQEQVNSLWEQLLRNYLAAHPEVLQITMQKVEGKS